eukprot:SAG11_NODE_532_length_8707_cov_11.936578_6_plen_64_part_00
MSIRGSMQHALAKFNQKNAASEMSPLSIAFRCRIVPKKKAAIKEAMAKTHRKGRIWLAGGKSR